MAPPHLINLAGQVEGVHHLFAGRVSVTVDHPHHRANPVIERTCRAISLQFVVLDEVETGFGQNAYKLCSLISIETHTGLYNRADQRPMRHAAQVPCTGDPKLWPRIGRSKVVWQAKIQYAQTGKLLQLKQISGKRGHQIWQRRPDVIHRPGQGNAGLDDCLAHDRARQAGGIDSADHFKRLDPCGSARFEFGGFARHRNEGAR